MTNFASGKRAWSISDRSGLRFPYNEMLFEPGTGIWVHKSETDGQYNIVDHPQGRVKAPKGDAISLENIYGDGREDEYPEFLVDENGDTLVIRGMFGIELGGIVV